MKKYISVYFKRFLFFAIIQKLYKRECLLGDRRQGVAPPQVGHDDEVHGFKTRSSTEDRQLGRSHKRQKAHDDVTLPDIEIERLSRTERRTNGILRASFSTHLRLNNII